MTTVLIIEDNPINRDVLGRRLTKRGFNVRFAVDGPSGVEATREINPDVVLMDIGLGDKMDGCEATRLIKSDPETVNIPVIALTASAFETDKRKAFEAGCNDFDTKPVDLVRLLGKIKACLPHHEVPGV